MAQRNDRMGAFDAVLYGIEGDPLLRSGIIAFIVLDGPPDREKVTERAERLTRLFPRLRERAVGNSLSPAPPRWETDPNFDPGYHVRWRRLPRGADDIPAALAYAARMGDQDFDHSRPLWEIAILTDLADGRAAVIYKVHHSVADGMGGLAMSASLFDLESDPGDLGPMPPAPVADPAGLIDRFVQAAAFEAAALQETAVGAARAYVHAARGLLTSPIDTTVSGVRTAAAFAAMIAPPGGPKSEWMSDRSLTCAFNMIEVPLEPITRAARAAGVTLNIVFVAAVADAFGTYHRRNGHALSEFRVNMPVNQRTPADAVTGNHWVPARFVLPTDDVDATARLAQLHGLIEDARQDPALELSEVLYKAMALLPAALTERLAAALMKGVDVAATNVPGPPVGVYLCGAKVLALVPFAPKAGAAINIGLLTYDGSVLLGINSDPAAVRDPDEFAACLEEAFAKYAV
ncbi:wax ester/triacylglycerol synthase family O-acyltransferase [Gordonia defluvii]|uniref:diacylglycerol O-acyltransferase n=1 Tax=Gordonia defluvii TaxID=283718 RepID=A0ABP6LFD2_9ACTN|nr:wax ester/triacylglycerol synthase domain-containing protein [Gordonia sp. UBA5067]